ncbi:Anaphase-promoting complex subunit 2 [Vitis vinifera]|uniref:Anaphase-promoting complex subunit 2 n=1 Tax=Vitis vinifera TaxID=29760 RepID=A0A438HI39_VITVI|nr:Anaphase-promoting complex subunit 2 [Vitis vinifera]
MEAASSVSDLGILDSVDDASITEIMESWDGFCRATEALLNGHGDLSVGSEFVSHVHSLCKRSLGSLVQDHFLRSLEETFERNGAKRFWRHFDAYTHVEVMEMSKSPVRMHGILEFWCFCHVSHECEMQIQENGIQKVLYKALDDVSLEKQYQEKCLLMLVHALQSYKDSISEERHNSDAERIHLFSKYQLIVSSVLMTTLPRHFPGSCFWIFTLYKHVLDLNWLRKVGGVSTIMAGEYEDDNESDDKDDMDLDEKNKVSYRGKVVRDLRNLGFTSMTEDAYASAIFLLLKDKVHNLAGDDYRSSVLESIKEWIQAVPLQFLYALLAYLGDSMAVAAGVFAYETLQDLRIAKLFEIIVDYPDSSPAIEDLKQCLEYTGQHSKLVDSFISALRYRLLTAVGEPIRDYLRGRKDTIKCIVTMLTDGTGGNPNGPGNTGDSLLEELNRDEENQENAGIDDDFNIDEKQDWINAERWEPDPVEADPSKGSRNRRKVDILGMIVGIIGSKDQLVNEYRVMLAEKLLNKSDYDIDSEIRTLELLKAGSELGETGVSLDILDATIISSNFWPPIQDEALNIPGPVDQLLADYAKRFHKIKTPRKLLWKKNLGTVKLELQFEGRVVQFTVAPLHAAIIMQFQDQTSWTSKNLAASIGVPVDVLNRRINFWISKVSLTTTFSLEAKQKTTYLASFPFVSLSREFSRILVADPNDHIFTLVDDMVEPGKNSVNAGSCEELLVCDEEGERSVASVEDQLHKEMMCMSIYIEDDLFSVVVVVKGCVGLERINYKFIMGMLTNFGSMALDRIHNTLKMFCLADPPYDKSLQQLQSFLSGLVSEEKLEIRDGMYFLKK